MRTFLLLPLLFISIFFQGCGTNPVTGKKEIQIISESTEIEIGENSYAPMKQVEGSTYTVHPGVAKYVSDVGQKLAKMSDRPDLPYEFSVLNNSVPNAWALPGGKISINRGLLTKLHSEAELAAVIAHEIVHGAARHGAKGIERSIGLQLGLAGLGAASAGLQFQDLILGSAGIGANLINAKYSRKQEEEADYYGIKYMYKAGYDTQAAVSLQELFVKLSKNRRSDWLSGLFASHPPSKRRVEKNKKTLEQFPPGGVVGKEKYEKMMKKLIDSQEAYKKFDEGTELLLKGKPKEALSLAKGAIKIEPKEALLYALAGEAYATIDPPNYKKALSNYDKAIKLHPDYFLFYVERGLVNTTIGDESSARRDFENSIKILPTANAHYFLGMFDLRNGNKNSAIKHLKIAAASDSEIGQMARQELEKLGE